MDFQRFIRTLALSSLFLALLPFAGAQEFRGKIQGLVTDTSGAIIPGASVTLLNIKTSVQTVRLTNDAGLYRFDNVDPGSYSITIQQAGFAKFIQENIDVQAQADITVNPVLKVGTLTDTVTVTDSPASIEFNTANVTTTVDSKLVNEVPRLDRNPFKLTLLNPAAMDTRRNEMNPFQSLSVNSVDLGGGTSQKNDLIVDGSPISIGTKASHVPNPDAVQEVVVQQNSVDAENGHSAGGTISMTMKSGTNSRRMAGPNTGRTTPGTSHSYLLTCQ